MPGRPTIWITVGQGPTALAAGAGGGCLDIFTLIYPFYPLSPSLWETARYRLKYCLKRPLNPKQPTNQPTMSVSNVIYHKFSHGAAFYTLNGKNVNVMLESLLITTRLNLCSLQALLDDLSISK